MTHPENPTETNSTSANLTIPTVDGRSFSLETDSASRFQFLSPQNLKNSNWQAKNPDSDEKPKFWQKKPRSQRKFSRSRQKNPDSSDISCKSGEYLIEFGKIS